MQQLIITDGKIMNGYISDYHTLDFTLTEGFNKNHIRLSAGVKNVFDNKTIAAIGNGGGHGSGGGASNSMDIAWGRTLFFRLTYTFNKYN